MNYECISAKEKHFPALENLMQFYMYDFSAYLKMDVEINGKFAPYPELKNYLNDKNKFPYILLSDGNIIGFVLIKFVADDNYFSVAEFFIMKKYRRLGLGKKIALHIFDLHKGAWEIFQREENKSAQIFWKNVINEYTGGKMEEWFAQGRFYQRFNN